ncbi:family 43 glycosylhydrolase [Pseudoflavonifractor capillosus]|uniref:family 43 glycosylhydrolase n=1 Tax=Pseudoflavonifractor capillosus TaxID=106588 RepID=UPI00195DF7E8|nr:family 43 glycosylhydrolase [Pseudoflavonifractor capillosus]MBM6695138.1 family 43 glycosylhydrolase [Pseudoflavonifractor capillosus]
MRNTFLKRAVGVALALTMTLSAIPLSPRAVAASDSGNETFTNPVMYADVPDVDVIRVDDAYYMVSTTMHLSPGCPVMKSTDLVNWETVSYTYDILDDGDKFALRNGESDYGNGSWAASIRHYNGKYYVSFASLSTGKTYIFSTTDVENGTWHRSEFNGYLHDVSLLTTQDDGMYVVYGSGTARCRPVYEDENGDITLGDEVTLIEYTGLDNDGNPVNGPVSYISEGIHAYEIGDYYYLFMIQWPTGGRRQEICWRASSLDGPWESRKVFDSGLEFDGQMDNAGVAQGGVVQAADGSWYAMLFQDHSSVGRIPVLVPVTWEDGWPVFGDENGQAPVEMDLPGTYTGEKDIVVSDEFYNGQPHSFAADNSSVSTAADTAAQNAAAVEAQPTADQEAERMELIVNGSFEDGTEPWAVQEAATLTPVDEDGNTVLLVSDRTNTTSGPKQVLTGQLSQGQKVQVSAKVKYNDGPASKTFNFCIQCGDWRGIDVVGSVTAQKGQWATITGTYTIPNDADMSYVGCFIETAWTATPDPTNDLFDFYVDDVSVTVEAEEPGYGIIVNGGFENGSEPWAVQEASTLEIVTEEAFSGSYSAKISDRTNTASGPKQVLTGQLSQGQKVQVSAKVKYNDGPASKTFNFCIQCGDWRGIDVVGSVTAQKGQWATITGTYTIPNDADMSYVGCFIETAWTAAPDPTNDLFDFYVDDVSVVVLPDEKEPVEPGENDDNGSYLDLAWQWNHNPNNNDWSLTQRNGFLRLTTGTKAKNILEARNTLTQRTYGPTCSGNVALEIAGMKNGDVAGLAAFQQRYGYVGVKMENGTKYLVMTKTESDSDPNGTEVERVALDNGVNRVYLRVDFDYTQRKDQATFFYSLDGAAWTQIGNTLQMAYTMPHFMGYRFGLFNYATQTTGGYVDFDYFHVSDQGSNGSETVLNASLDDIDDVLGVAYAQVELPVKLDTLPDGDYTKLEASLNIPDDFTVSGVVFDEKNVTGDATYTYQDGRLVLTVSGEDVNYQDNGGTGFATVQLQLTDYTTQNKTVQVRTDYVRVTGGNVSYRVDNAVSNISLVKLDSEALAKIPGYSNPLIDYDFGADPFALEYNGRVYVYMTADQFEYDQNGNIIDNTYSKINSLHVISSADLVNWTDHGFIPVAGPNGVAKWANNSWAPAIAYKQIDGQDKFFLYFCNGGGGIGVLEGDSPVGPFTDPLGHALIDGSTPGTQGVPWIFDPAVMVDDDGTGYLVFGGGIPAGQDLNPKSARIVRLGDDMISLDCEPVMIDAPCMFEDGGIHKANGKYYYTYCSNFSGNHSAVEGYPGYGIICYMVSDDPLGPYEYCGEILQNPSTYFGVGGNNHHAIFNFKGTSYIVYHAQTLGQAMGIEKGYRSTHINEVEYYADGRIVPIQADREGISQLETMSPYQLTAGETIAWQAGIKVEACDQPGQGLSEVNNRAVTDIQNGDWIAVAGLDFGDKGAASFTASIAAQAGGAVELRVDSPDGTVVGTLTVPAGDGTYQTLTCDVEGLTGVHNLFMVFTGDDQAENLMSLDTWQFTEAGESASANKALLQATYDYAVNLDTTGVVQAAVDAFQKALTEAKAVLDNPNATQEQVNTAWDNLLEGIWGLGLKQGDKTMLELLIHRAEGMLPNESKYLPDHWQELLDALAAGQDVMEDGNALQGDVETAVDELLTAILAQRFKADKSILEDLIGAAQDMDLTGYTAESVSTFRSALAAAQAVMADESLSEDDQQVVDDAVAALQSAMDGLTAEGDVQPSEKPQESQKPEQTQAPEATDQPQATQKPENVPQTGDSAQLMGYVAALTAAVGLLAGAAYVSRKRRS